LAEAQWLLRPDTNPGTAFTLDLDTIRQFQYTAHGNLSPADRSNETGDWAGSGEEIAGLHEDECL